MASAPPGAMASKNAGGCQPACTMSAGLRVVRVHRIAEQDLIELVGIGAGRHRDTLDGRVGAPAVPPGLDRLLDVPLELRLGRKPEPAAVDLDGGEVGDPEGRGAKVGIDGVGDTLRPAAPRVAGHPLVWEGVGPVVGEDERRRCRIVGLRCIQQLAPVDPQVRPLRGETGVDPPKERTHLHHFVTYLTTASPTRRRPPSGRRHRSGMWSAVRRRRPILRERSRFQRVRRGIAAYETSDARSETGRAPMPWARLVPAERITTLS